MPVDDWRRVTAGTFHDFHVAWIAELRGVLNGGLLPRGYYALAEQVAGEIIPDRGSVATGTMGSWRDPRRAPGAGWWGSGRFAGHASGNPERPADWGGMRSSCAVGQ
jgi:hypothetical protein